MRFAVGARATLTILEMVVPGAIRVAADELDRVLAAVPDPEYVDVELDVFWVRLLAENLHPVDAAEFLELPGVVMVVEAQALIRQRFADLVEELADSL